MVNPIRVLLVEDSPVALLILRRMLETAPDIEVVGTAKNGQEALDLISTVMPTVICTDYQMPGMDGLEFIQRVMQQFPRPILVISALIKSDKDDHIVFQLLQAGAVDIFPKPEGGIGCNYEQVQQELISKVRILSGVTVFTKHLQKSQTVSKPATLYPEERTYQPKVPQNSSSSAGLSAKAIAIGASTGGPQALHTILTQLPVNLAIPVFCVQHISIGFLQGLVDWLADNSRLPIRIAQSGTKPLPGVIYFAPEQTHLEFDSQGFFICRATTPVDGHCPSATVLFQSSARLYGRGLIGILLSGMGRDGASGMQDIALAGGLTIAQNEQSCVVFGMPKEAIALGAVKHVLPITEIPGFLKRKLENP